MKIRNILTSEEGSAIVEFIALALPLFIPLAIFMSNAQSDASIQHQTRSLARQLSRIYVTSENEAEGINRVTTLREVFIREIFRNSKYIQNPEIKILCSSSPCLLPGSTVQVSVVVRRNDGTELARVSAKEIVDLWKNS